MNILRTYKIILFCFLLVVCGLYPDSPVVAQTKKLEGTTSFVTTGFLYDRCKEAINNAGTNQEDFPKTFCAAHISGFLSAALVYSWVIPIHDPQDQCEEEKLEIYKGIQNMFCFPENLSLVQMATDFVSWIEAADFQMPREQALESISMYGLAEAFNAIYSCRMQKIREKRMGATDGLDD